MKNVPLPSTLEKKLKEPITISSHEIARPANHQTVTQALEKIYQEITQHYNKRFAKSPLRELIQNAYTHVKANTPINVDLFLTNDDLLAYRCQDGGDYFADEHIKHLWENRKDPPASEQRTTGHYLGHVAVYLFTKDLLIDTDTASVYATQEPLD